jgi:Fe-S oxidoreductase
MAESGHISYAPTDGLTYDPSDDKYWDKEALGKEIVRTFEICHGCRLCFKYCESFPILFNKLDSQEIEFSDVRLLTDDDVAEVMVSCFQCKLCEVQCPYTVADEHEFQLDFPKLVHRYNAIRTKNEGNSFSNKLLANPDRLGRISRASMGLANFANSVHLFRVVNEKVLGIHRDKILPTFPQQTFDKWAEKEGRIDVPDAEVVLFQTCYVQNNEPQIGKDVLEVMDHNKVKSTCSKGLECCGMPAWEIGDLDTVRKNASKNLDKLLPMVEDGAKVIVVNPTCSMMMKKEYPELLEGEDRSRAEKLSEAIMDTSEYLWSIRKEERFNIDFKSTPNGEVAYHVPCHLRAQRIGFPARSLMKKVPDVKVKTNMECSGHDGTYAMKKDTFESSMKVGKKAFDGMGKEPKVMVSDCPLAAVQFEQAKGERAMHPMSFLAKAYREDGFDSII